MSQNLYLKDPNKIRKTVLIIDDDEDILEIMANMLEALDVHILKAEDGKQALSYLGTLQIDVVVTDLMMPNINGFIVCDELKKLEIPFIVASGYHDHLQILEEKYKFDTLPKPFSMQALIEKVKEKL